MGRPAGPRPLRSRPRIPPPEPPCSENSEDRESDEGAKGQDAWGVKAALGKEPLDGPESVEALAVEVEVVEVADWALSVARRA